MMNIKNCPQCNKELPITASNCKYCGATLENASNISFFEKYSENQSFSAYKDVSGNESLSNLQSLPKPQIQKLSAPGKKESLGQFFDFKETTNDDDLDEPWISPEEKSELIDLEDMTPVEPVSAIDLESGLLKLDDNSSNEEKTMVMEMPDQYLAKMNAQGASLPLVETKIETKREIVDATDKLFRTEDEDSELIDLEKDLNPSSPQQDRDEDSAVFDLHEDTIVEPMPRGALLEEESSKQSGLVVNMKVEESSALIDLDNIEPVEESGLFDLDAGPEIAQEAEDSEPVIETASLKQAPEPVIPSTPSVRPSSVRPSASEFLNPQIVLENETVYPGQKEFKEQVPLPVFPNTQTLPPTPVTIPENAWPSSGNWPSLSQPQPVQSVQALPSQPVQPQPVQSVSNKPVPKQQHQPKQEAAIKRSDPPSESSHESSSKVIETTAKVNPEEIKKRYYAERAGFFKKISLKSSDYFDSISQTKKIVLASLIAFVVTMAIAVYIMQLLRSIDSEKIEVVIVSDTVSQKDVSTPIKAESQIAKSPEEKEVHEEPEPEPEPEEPALPKPGTECTKLSEYQKKLPWGEYLNTAAKAVSASGLCSVFGHSSPDIAADFDPSISTSPTGYDWIENGEKFTVYPEGKIDSSAPHIDFLFSNKGLYSIRMNLKSGTDAQEATAQNLGKIFKKNNTEKDKLGRNVVFFTDGDLNIKLYEEQWYGTTLRTIEFSNTKIDEYLKETDQKREDIAVKYKAAQLDYFNWNFEDALKGYKSLIALDETIGDPLIKAGLIYLRMDDFNKAKDYAKSALEVTNEDPVKAEAYGILAIVALKNNEAIETILYLRKADALSLGDNRFRSQIKMLETGNYPLVHLAQTAARFECIKKRKIKSSESSILARGFFPDKSIYQTNLNKVAKSRNFRNERKKYMDWECR